MATSRLQEVLQRFHDEDPLGVVRACGIEWQVERLEARRYSSIYLLRCDAAVDYLRQHLGSNAVILKLYHVPHAARRQKEFDDLQRVYEAMAPQSDIGIVRPLAAFAEHGAIFTARAPGASAAHLVRAAARRGGDDVLLQRVEVLCARPGTWLQSFQQVGVQAMHAMRPRHLGTPASFAAYVDERLEILERQRLGIGAELRARSQSALRRAFERLPPTCLDPVTWSHADFGAHNILVDGERLTLLDFDLAPEHPCFDAAYFVEALAGLSGALVDRARVQRFERAFLDAHGAPEHRMLFELFRLRHLVCSYVSQARLRGLARLRVWPDLRRMRSRLTQMVLRLEESPGPIRECVPS